MVIGKAELGEGLARQMVELHAQALERQPRAGQGSHIWTGGRHGQ
jgi:hypothetical protein